MTAVIDPVTNCNLCGSKKSVVSCEKCDSRTFCISCDDMYHRHPKRRYHFRMPLDKPKNQQANSMPHSNFGANFYADFNQPSKSTADSMQFGRMPIPPPRRKKKTSQTESKKVYQTNPQFSGGFTDSWTSSGPSNQARNAPRRGMSDINSGSVSSDRWSSDLSADIPPALPQKNKWLQASQNRRNHSLMDLRDPNCQAQYAVLMNNLGPPPIASQMIYHSPYPPMVYQKNLASITQSFEDLQMSENDLYGYEDDLDQDDDISQTKFSSVYHKSRGRTLGHRSNMRNRPDHLRRAKSSLMIDEADPWQRVPMIYPYPPIYYPSSPRCPPPPPMPYPYRFQEQVPSVSGFRGRSKSHRSEIDPESSTSSQRNSPVSDEVHSRRSGKLDRDGLGRRSSDQRWSKASSRSTPFYSSYHSDSQSQSTEDQNMSDKTSSNFDLSTKKGKKWSCRGCTYLNNPKSDICEMCGKSHPKRLARIAKQNREDKESKCPAQGSKCPAQGSKCPAQESDDQRATLTSDPELESFSQDLVREQEEIERELRRRIENEKRVEEENQRVERKRKMQLQIGEEEKQVKVLSSAINNQTANSTQAIQAIQETFERLEREIDKIASENEGEKVVHQKVSSDDLVEFSDPACAAVRPSQSTSVPIPTCSSNAPSQASSEERQNAVSEASAVPPQNTFLTTANPIANNLLINQTPISTSYISTDLQRTQPNSFQLSNHPQNNQFYQQPTNYLTTTAPHLTSSIPFHSPMSRLIEYAGPSQGHIWDPRLAVLENPYGPSLLASKYSSIENLHRVSALPTFQTSPSMANELIRPSPESSAGLQSTSNSGLEVLKLVKEAEAKGFISDDLEIAINFDPQNPLDWLEDNWNNMIDTVRTLSNNQQVQSEKKRSGAKLNLMNIIPISRSDAVTSLRACKGNIWQAIDKCVQQNEVEKASSKSDVKSFSLQIKGTGSGSNNMEANISMEPENVAPKILDAKLETLTSTKSPESVADSNEYETNQDEHDSDAGTSAYEECAEDTEVHSNQDLLVETANRPSSSAKQRYFSSFEDSDHINHLRAEELKSLGQVVLEQFAQSTDEDEVVGSDLGVREEHEQLFENEKKIALRNEELGGSFEQRLRDRGLHQVHLLLSESSSEMDSEKQGKDHSNPHKRSSLSLEIDRVSPIEQNENRQETEASERSLDLDSAGSSSKAEHEISSEIITDGLPLQKMHEKCHPELPLEHIDKSMEKSFQILDSLLTQASSDKRKLKSVQVSGQNSTESVDEKMNPIVVVSIEIDDLSLEWRYPDIKSISFSETTTEEVSGEQSSLKCKVESPKWSSPYYCELCASNYSIKDMVSMIACTHKSCVQCLQQYFTVQIREHHNVLIQCPFCQQPNIDPDDEDKVCEYLSLLDQQVKTLVTPPVHELFQRKLRDRVLSKDPAFRWCTNCSSGFIAADSSSKRITCPDCDTSTCVLCGKAWLDQHANISCRQFQEWQKLNDPEFATNQLELHLSQFGIECPKCSFHYELSKGGCMHFKCLQCGHDFCGGCKQPFRMGSHCKVSVWCKKLGLHAHHPRNCLFYLRDKSVTDLKNLLEIYKIQYQQSEVENSGKTCPIIEQKELPDGLEDLPCGNPVDTIGVCRQHYTEYLGGLIFQNNIDPIEIFTEDDLMHVLRRDNIKLPTLRPGSDYRKILVETIKRECPLVKEVPKM